MANTIKDTLEVFSAHAEVVPDSNRTISLGGCILRARGGSSDVERHRINAVKYSLRTRR